MWHRDLLKIITSVLILLFALPFREAFACMEGRKKIDRTNIDYYMSYGQYDDACAISGEYIYLLRPVLHNFQSEIAYFTIERINLNSGETEEIISEFFGLQPILLSTDTGVYIVSLDNYADEFSIWLLSNNTPSVRKMYSDKNGGLYKDALIHEQNIILISKQGIDIFNTENLDLTSIISLANESITNTYWNNHAVLYEGFVFFSNNFGKISMLNLYDGTTANVLESYYADTSSDQQGIIQQDCGYRGYVVLSGYIIYYNRISDSTISKSLFTGEETTIYNGKISFRVITREGIFATVDKYPGEFDKASICYITFSGETYSNEWKILPLSTINTGNTPEIPVLMAYGIATDIAIEVILEHCRYPSSWF